MNNFYYTLFLIALNTGMRLGEIAGLCWDCVDFNRKQIIIKRTMTRIGLEESTKSKKNRINGIYKNKKCI